MYDFLELIKEIFEENNYLVCVMQKPGIYIYINKSFRFYIKKYYNVDINTGDNVMDKFSRDVWEPVLENLNKAYTGIFKRSTGKFGDLWFDTDYSIIKKADEIVGILHIFRKVNDPNRDNLKSSDICKIVHELKNPLSAIIGFVELLQFNKESMYNHPYMKNIETASKDMLSMVNAILHTGKIANTEVKYKYIYIDKIIEKILEKNTPMILAKSITIKKDIKNSMIFSSKYQLKCIINNLVENAIKYNCINGEIFIYMKYGKFSVENDEFLAESNTSCDELEETIFSNTYSGLFIIKNTGPIIESKYFGKIFNSFFRISNDQKGHGLGLNTCKKMSNKINGKLTVSTDEKCNIFKLYIP